LLIIRPKLKCFYLSTYQFLFFFILTTVQFNTYRKAEYNQESRKKIKKRYGLSINNSTEYFRQEDFKSQQKWKIFEKYVVHNRKMLKNTKRKNRQRRNVTILNLC